YKYESELVDNFIYLKNFQNEYIEECPFRWGNIDLVEYETSSFRFLSELQIKELSNKESLLIFSMLYKSRPHTFEYILKKLDLTKDRLVMKLKSLERTEIVVKAGNLYSINNNIDFPDIIVRAYEMKLTDIRKAINQAVINKQYCDYSYVVMPEEKRKLCLEYKDIFQKCSIGLLLVDNNNIKEVVRAKRIKEVNYNKLASKIKIVNFCG
ncbi:hypothetical protein EZ543_04710, partial [Listeria monocytogenes]|nr:hypothetical protein [Listeria monocytogenes]MDD61166.1 hypothetical protein [Listeria monocytogenes]